MKANPGKLGKSVYNGLGKVYTKLTGKDVLSYEEAQGVKQPDGPIRDEDVDKPIDSWDDAPEEKGRKKNGSGKKVIVIVGILAIIAVLAALLPQAIQSLQPPAHAEINLVDMVMVEKLTGMNGYGEITIALDKVKLRNAIIACIPNAEEYPDEQIQAWTDGVANYITLDVNKTKSLSNGDVVKVTVTFDEQQALEYSSIEFKNGTASVTVSGLSDSKLVEPLTDDAIGLDITGTSGSAEATLNIKLAGPYVYYLHYDFEPKKALSNGDIVTVSIKPDDKRLADLGYGVSGVRTREFSVTGLPEPVTDYHEIPDTMINSMVSYAEGDLAKEFANLNLSEEDSVIVAPEITSIYFLDEADKSAPYTDWFSGLSMVNGVAVLGHFFAQDIDRQYVNTDDPENPVQTVDTVLETYGGYYVWIFPNVMRTQTGTIEYDTNMIKRDTTSEQTEGGTLARMKRTYVGFSFENMGTNSGAVGQAVE